MAKLLLVVLLFNLNTLLITSLASPNPNPTPTNLPPITPKQLLESPSPSKTPYGPLHPATNWPEPGTCPIDALSLGVCVDVLWGLIHFGIGSGAKYACCPVLDGLVGFDAALCLCTSISLKLLDISIVFPVALEVLVNECGKQPPQGFQCPFLVN